MAWAGPQSAAVVASAAAPPTVMRPALVLLHSWSLPAGLRGYWNTVLSGANGWLRPAGTPLEGLLSDTGGRPPRRECSGGEGTGPSRETFPDLGPFEPLTAHGGCQPWRPALAACDRSAGRMERPWQFRASTACAV